MPAEAGKEEAPGQQEGLLPQLMSSERSSTFEEQEEGGARREHAE